MRRRMFLSSTVATVSCGALAACKLSPPPPSPTPPVAEPDPNLIKVVRGLANGATKLADWLKKTGILDAQQATIAEGAAKDLSQLADDLTQPLDPNNKKSKVEAVEAAVTDVLQLCLLFKGFVPWWVNAIFASVLFALPYIETYLGYPPANSAQAKDAAQKAAALPVQKTPAGVVHHGGGQQLADDFKLQLQQPVGVPAGGPVIVLPRAAQPQPITIDNLNEALNVLNAKEPNPM